MSETTRKAKILVYSSNSTFRGQVLASLGSNLGAEFPEHEIKEFATGPALRLYFDEGKSAELVIVDAESTPEGGLGLARQLKDEVYNCPPVLAAIARPTDSWLGTWSRAEELILLPIDPFTLAEKARTLLAIRLGLSLKKDLVNQSSAN
jgi:hypothetical protein